MVGARAGPTVQVARFWFGCWAVKASKWTPATPVGDVQRIHRPSTVCFHSASLRAVWRR